MHTKDEPRFLNALASLETLLRDQLSKDYKKLYFAVTIQKGWTIEEWEGACVLALGDETFHAVPLPGAMQRYIDELRAQEKESRVERDRIAAAERKQLYAAEQAAEHRQRQLDALQQLEASQAKLAKMWGEEWLTQHKRMMDPSNTEKEAN